MSARGWRVGHQGRDQMYYEEWHDGAWRRIDIDGEMLTGRAHHVIYFAPAARWREYPAWARDRRTEIISRITSEFRPPDYEYYGFDDPGNEQDKPEPVVPPSPSPVRKPSPPQGIRALMLVILLLFAISASMAWLTLRGLQRNDTTLPLPRSFLRRPVPRTGEPAMFWVSIGIYATLAAGTFTLGTLGTREMRRMVKPR